MIVVDTSVLVDALTGPRRSAPAMRSAIDSGERLLLPSLVIYEWLRGPRLVEELAAQEALFPLEEAIAFGAEDAAIAARLYAETPRARGREIDLAVAALALSNNAALWTLNQKDFGDIPGLELYESGS